MTDQDSKVIARKKSRAGLGISVLRLDWGALILLAVATNPLEIAIRAAVAFGLPLASEPSL